MVPLLMSQRSARLEGSHSSCFQSSGFLPRPFFPTLPIIQVEIAVLVQQGCEETVC